MSEEFWVSFGIYLIGLVFGFIAGYFVGSY